MSGTDSGPRGSDHRTLNRAQSQPVGLDLLSYVLSGSDPFTKAFDTVADALRGASAHHSRFKQAHGLQIGRVVHAVPYLNWYKVQVDEVGPPMSCAMMSQGSLTNIGVRPTAPIGPNNAVIVWVPKGINHGFILGVLPQMIAKGEVSISDWLQQGGQAGAKREDVHKSLIQRLFRSGGVKDFSNRRAIDATAWEWGMMSESGIGINISSWDAFLRVSEACGLFLSAWGHHARLAGINYDFQSPVEQMMIREDEGENVQVTAGIVYPWEAVGCYKDGVVWTKEFEDKDVHFTKPRGKIDLDEGEEDLQPVMRYVEYGGYLGQPRLRQLMAPEKKDGKRFYKDEPYDNVLWQEILSLDGGYAMRSAKSLYFGHRVLIPNPKRKRLTEDQKTGDDARRNNYKFSSKFGSGDEHKVGDVKVEGDQKGLLRAAGVLDLLTYTYNWKSFHPFHYHKEDYKLWDESKLLGHPFDAAQDKLSFGELAGKDFMSYPTPKQIHIDHRYGDVDYFQRESFFAFHEDGALHLGCGYGAELVFTGGSILATCPGDFQILAGKRIVGLSWDTVFRAKNSMDFSATEKDIRFKAKKNMQFVAGVGGKGGILFESQSTGSSQTYQGLYGEDVQANGIVFLARHSQVGVLAKDILLRTGGADIDEGNIALDASKGDKRVTLYGKHINMFANKAVQIWNSPQGEESNADAGHRFAKSTSIISGNLIIEKNVVVTKGNLRVRKYIGSGDNIIAKKKLVQEKPCIGTSGYVAGHMGKFDPDPDIDKAEEGRMKFVQTGDKQFEADLVLKWYEKGMLGADDTIKPMGFSFRDPPSPGAQYKTTQFKLYEPRWQQMVRLQQGSGGTAWTEDAVTYQGQQTYPWPGKQKWVSEPTMLCYEKHTLYDDAKRCAQDRPGPYESPKLGSWQPVQPDGQFKTVL